MVANWARAIQSFFILGLLQGCQFSTKVLRKVDYYSFAKTGGTFFSDPSRVSMKAIHLDANDYQGAALIVEGDVESIGSHATHLVMTDQGARLLVGMSEMTDADAVVGQELKRRIMVLGRLERDKKGLPILVAYSIRHVDP